MRKFLVVLDDSRECLNAMRFAAMRAARSGGGVTILSVIPPERSEAMKDQVELDPKPILIDRNDGHLKTPEPKKW